MSGITPRPSTGLAIASGLVQGVQQGMNAYYDRTRQQQQMQLQQQQMQSTAQLRQFQMMKLQQEVMPQQIDAAKINGLMNWVDNGIPGAEQALNYQMKKTLDGVQTPAQAQVLNQWMQSHAAGRAPSPMPGGDSSAPTTNMAPLAPGQAPTVGMAPPAQPVSQFMLNPAERKIVDKIYQGRIQQNIAGANNQNRLQGIDMNNMTRAQLEQMRNDHDAQMKNIDERIKKYDTDQRLVGTKYTADTTLERQRIANKKPSGSKASKDPVEASVLKQIEGVQKSINDLSKPPSGLSMELPADVKRRVDSLKAEQQRLYSTYQAHTGRPYPGSSPSGAQPAAGGKGPTPPAGAPMSLKDFQAASKGTVPVGTIVDAGGGQKYKVIDLEGHAEPVQ